MYSVILVMISLFVDLFMILWFMRVIDSLCCICFGAVAQDVLDMKSSRKLCSHTLAFGYHVGRYFYSG
jgi:hypothetical protein